MNNKYVDTSRLNHIATTNKIVMYQESINKYFSLFGDKSNFCFYNQINDLSILNTFLFQAHT